MRRASLRSCSRCSSPPRRPGRRADPDYDIDVAIRSEMARSTSPRTDHRARRRQPDSPRHLSRFPDALSGPLRQSRRRRTSKFWACSATARPSPGSPSRSRNGVRINTGNDDFLPAPAEHTFTLRYRTTRQLGFFADHDELYWNAIGTGWIVPDRRRSCRSAACRPPVADRSDERRRLHRLSGRQRDGLRGGSLRARSCALAPHAAVESAGRLHDRRSRFPKGLIAAPSAVQRVGWLLKDNRGVLVALLGLVLLIALLHARMAARRARS